MKCYRNMTTDEVVYKEEAKDYALHELGLMNNGKLVIIPKGKNGEMTAEQLENLESTIDWFFSGNWIEEDIYDEDVSDLEYELELADREYQDELDRKWGLM